MAVRSDVCLILEGTYPYVSGGVSSWVHQLVTSLSGIRFSLLTILPSEAYGREAKYQLPPNIMEMSTCLIHNYEVPDTEARGDREAAYRQLGEFLEGAAKDDYSRFPEMVQILAGNPPVISPHDLLFSHEGWDLLRDIYQRYGTGNSFIDYFWTYRFSLLPLLRAISTRIPRAHIYHSISTGYAGLIGAVAVAKNPGASYIVTEHGIYAKERRIEIFDAKWIYDEYAGTARPDHGVSFFREWWVQLFQSFSRITYWHADEIIALYQGNKQLQVLDGADPSRCRVIPNGLDPKKFGIDQPHPLPTERKKKIVALVGRVVPIKDVKTFISACRLICEKLPDVECWVCGPYDEDPQYYGDCLVLQSLLGLKERLIFKGKLNLREFYPQMDVVVLTSVSEAMPLVILEANCYGVPVVATDVGACRELVNGQTPEDAKIGPSGLITGVANAPATAEAVVRILSNDELYEEMSRAGKTRVSTYYQEKDLLAQYLNLYEQYL